MISRAIVLAASFFVLFGCAVPVQNAHEAKLMPEEVARKILSGYFGAGWASQPYGYANQASLFQAIGCKGEYPMPFDTIKVLDAVNAINGKSGSIWVRRFNPHGLGIVGMIISSCAEVATYQVSRPSPFSREELNDISDALYSLGAKLDAVNLK
jgi:hypothetical protein